MKVLLVCTGNTCRSSMAEVMLKDLVKKAGLAEEITIQSAGTTTVQGLPAAKHAIEVMQEKCLDLNKHRSTPLSKEILQEADLVLTMTRRHKKAVLELEPKLQTVYTLKEYAVNEDNGDLDISDPYGQPIQVYQQCSVEIEQELRKALEKIIKLM